VDAMRFSRYTIKKLMQVHKIANSVI